MVKKLAEKPSVFDRPQEGDGYYMLFNDDGPYAYITLNHTYPPVAMLHLEVKKFSHNLLKSAVKEDWYHILEMCMKNGCNIIQVQKEGSFESNTTWMKFIKHFGFSNFAQYTASSQLIGG